MNGTVEAIGSGFGSNLIVGRNTRHHFNALDDKRIKDNQQEHRFYMAVLAKCLDRREWQVTAESKVDGKTR